MNATQPPLINLPTPSTAVIIALNGVENIVVLTSQCVALTLFANLLIFAQFYGPRVLGRLNLQTSMKLFLLFHCIGIFTSIPATVNKIFLLLEPAKYLDLLFWILALNCNYSLSISPFFVLFLTVERLLMLQFPFKFKQYRKVYLMVVVLLTIFFYVLSFAFFIAELPLDPKISLGSSPGLIRIAPKFNFQPQSIIKMTFGFCNLLCSFCFFHLLKHEKSHKIKNRVVKFTVICELIFNISTGLGSILATTLTGRSLSSYVGVMENALMNLDLAICSVFYSWIFLVVARKHFVGVNVGNRLPVYQKPVQQPSLPTT